LKEVTAAPVLQAGAAVERRDMSNTLPTVVPQDDLRALAVVAREAHIAVGKAAATALEHAMRAGDALLAARPKVAHGGWAHWLHRNCDVSERMANNYMRLAEGRAQIEANRKRVSDLSVRGALTLIKAPTEPSPATSCTSLSKPSSGPKSKSSAVSKWDAVPKLMEAWNAADLEGRCRFINAIGLTGLVAAVPAAWREQLAEALAPPALPALTRDRVHVKREHAKDRAKARARATAEAKARAKVVADKYIAPAAVNGSAS
jgi:hypothetical protein